MNPLLNHIATIVTYSINRERDNRGCKIEIKGNIGIDESRNGQPWEVYVAVFSMKKKCMYPHSNLKKGRDSGRENVGEILKGNYFKYLILPKIEKDIMGEYRSKLACITEFLTLYQIEEEKAIRNLLIDGEIENSFDCDLERTLDVLCSTFSEPEGTNAFMPENILVEPRADTTYKIVNQADRVAYQLKHYHEIKGHRKDKYVDHKINPDWGYYKAVFDFVDVPNK